MSHISINGNMQSQYVLSNAELIRQPIRRSVILAGAASQTIHLQFIYQLFIINFLYFFSSDLHIHNKIKRLTPVFQVKALTVP